MTTPKYTRGSKMHFVLELLSLRNRDAKELREKTMYTSSILKFEREILAPMLEDKLIQRELGLVKLTTKGLEKYSELGVTKVRLAKAPKVEVVVADKGPYEGKELHKQQWRPAGNNHLNIPSRIGGKLIYRPDAEGVPA
jgi:hypothetical protein